MQSAMNRQARLMAEQQVNQAKIIAITTALTVYERFVIIDSGAAITVTLPSVAAARGYEFLLWLRTDGGDVTVADKADSIGWTNLTMNDAGDHLLMRSDGISWHAQKTGVA